MATYKAPKALSKRSELRKDAATTVFVRAQDAFSRHRSIVMYSGIGVAVVAVALVSYIYIQRTRNEQANEHLGGIGLFYERGEYRTALDGSGESLGLLDIADQYGSTKAGNMARFLAADAAFRLGEYDVALEHFEAYRGSGDVLDASALDGRAAILEMRQEYAEAGSLYERAARANENALRTPEYLKKAARAYTKAEEYDQAEGVLLTIREDYPESEFAQDLDYDLAFVRAKLQ